MTLMMVLAVLCSCGLPNAGPNKKQIYSGSVLEEGDAFVVEVNNRVTRATAYVPALGFSAVFRSAAQIGSDTIRPGDILGITIWENVDDGLLAGATQNATSLDTVQVDGDGFIFVPFAGRIKASGNSPEAVRRLITKRLQDQTPDSQVEVRREAGDGATVSLIGSVGTQGVYPIKRLTRTLSTMLARAGRVTIEPEITNEVLGRTDLHGDQRIIYLPDLTEPNGLFETRDFMIRGGDTLAVTEAPLTQWNKTIGAFVGWLLGPVASLDQIAN